MEKIKEEIYSVNKNINLSNLTTEQCHVLYFFYTKSELNKIDSTSFFKASNLILGLLNEEALKKIIQANEEKQEVEARSNTSHSNNTLEKPSEKIAEMINKNLPLSQKELIEKLKKASLIEKKWLVEYLLHTKDKTFSLDYLVKQKNNLADLIAQRKKNIIFFNQYLKKGKKTKELLNTKYFSQFKNEVKGILTFLISKKLTNQEDFFENYYAQKGAEETKIEELTFLKMLYDTTQDNQLKKIIYLAYTNFPERDVEQIKNDVLQKILSR